MTGRTAREAFEAFAKAFQQALSCVTQARFNTEGYRPIDLPYSADINGGAPASVSGDPAHALVVILRYRLLQEGGPLSARAVRIVERTRWIFQEQWPAL